MLVGLVLSDDRGCPTQRSLSLERLIGDNKNNSESEP